MKHLNKIFKHCDPILFVICVFNLLVASVLMITY